MKTKYIIPKRQKMLLYWLRELGREIEAKELGPYMPDDLARLEELTDEVQALVIRLRA